MIYLGVNGQAKQAIDLKVGVGGEAKSVSKIYAGVGGEAKLVYTTKIDHVVLRVAQTAYGPFDYSTGRNTWTGDDYAGFSSHGELHIFPDNHSFALTAKPGYFLQVLVRMMFAFKDGRVIDLQHLVAPSDSVGYLVYATAQRQQANNYAALNAGILNNAATVSFPNPPWGVQTTLSGSVLASSIPSSFTFPIRGATAGTYLRNGVGSGFGSTSITMNISRITIADGVQYPVEFEPFPS